MNNISIFLNTRVKYFLDEKEQSAGASGVLTWIGDKGLAPVRYLFNGKTICIEDSPSENEIKIHSVKAFHKDGYLNISKTKPGFYSASTGMIKTALAIALLIPGLLLAVFKGLAYLSADVRKKRDLVKEHFTPLDKLEIGSKDEPIENITQLKEELKKAAMSNPKNRPINALIIHGKALRIDEDPGANRFWDPKEDVGLCFFDPKKLILVDAYIARKASDSTGSSLDRVLLETGKWPLAKKGGEVPVEADQDLSIDVRRDAKTVDDALAVIPEKRYNMVFEIASKNTNRGNTIDSEDVVLLPPAHIPVVDE